MAANTDDQTTPAPSTDSSNPTPIYNLYPNQLRQFASFTYNIAFQVTTTQNYNAMAARNPQTYNPAEWTTIAKSGGLGSIKASRPGASAVGVNGPLTNAGTKTYFNRDLYIDDLEFQTFLSLSQDTRGTNSAEIHFKLTEPNGMNFIEELYDFCHDSEGLAEFNYTQLPYMLVINFIGYDELGTQSTAKYATKYIPIQIMNMSVKLDTTGAIYSIQAIPYNEAPFTIQYGSLRQSQTITGNTLADLVKQLADHINKEQTDLVKNGDVQVADQYSITILDQTTWSAEPNVTFSPTLSAAKIAVPVNIANKDTPFKSPPSDDDKSANVIAIAQNFLSYQYLDNVQVNDTVITVDKTDIKFSQWSAISDCLNNLVLSSEYITNQVKAFQQKLENIQKNAATLSQSDLQTQVNALNTPFNWYKIICDRVDYLGYDQKRQCYGRKIYITIKPFIVYNSRNNNAPSAPPDVRVLKQYNYLMTGKNTEVIDFDLNFQWAFLNFSQTGIATKGLGTGAQTPNRSGNDNSKVVVTQQPSIIDEGRVIVPSSESGSRMVGTGMVSPDRALAADIAATMYNVGDLLQIELTIMGDPDYIKQDEIFRKALPTLAAYATEGGGQPGGICFDAGQVYFNLVFLIPVDYNLETGLMDINQALANGNLKRNMFSGLYEVLTVDNTFSGGKFTQKIKALRFNEGQIYAAGGTTSIG